MPRILIADDHPITREPLARILAHHGYDAAAAANGVEALAAVQQRRPDLVLLDLMMPKMTGLEFLRALRSGACGSEGQDLPVILMTAVPDAPDVERARRLGVAEVIPKARFTVDELLSRVARHVPGAPSSQAEPAATG